MNSPTPEQRRFAEFCKTWDALPDYQREAFVQEFAADLHELLSGRSVQGRKALTVT
jgi:hypothetical protein